MAYLHLAYLIAKLIHICGYICSHLILNWLSPKAKDEVAYVT